MYFLYYLPLIDKLYMVEGKKKKSKFRIKWWWDSEDEEAAKKDPEYVQVLEKADEIIKEQDLSANQIKEKKDEIVEEAIKETKEIKKEENKETKKDENKGYFDDWFGGDNKEGTDITGTDLNSRKDKNAKDRKGTNVKGMDFNGNKKGTDVSGKDIGDNKKDTNARDRKGTDVEGKDVSGKDVKGKETKKDENKEGYFDNWFGGDNKEGRDVKGTDRKEDRDHKGTDRKDARDVKGTDVGGKDVKGTDISNKDSRDRKSKDVSGKDRKDENKEGYFDNWFGGNKKGTDRKETDDKGKNLEKSTKRSDDKDNIKYKDNENDKNRNKDKNDKSDKNIDKDKDNDQESEYTNTLLICCGCINLLLAILFFIYTELIIDETVTFNILGIAILIICILVPFILLPFYKNIIFRILAIISVILTIAILIYLFINRVRVYFFKISLDLTDPTEYKSLEKLNWSERNEPLFNLLKSKGYYLEEWVKNSDIKGAKIIILEDKLEESGNKWAYDKNNAEETLRTLISETVTEGKPPMGYPLIRYSWTIEESTRILKEIRKTRFSKISQNYGFVIGVFDKTMDFIKIIGTEPVTLYDSTFDPKANKDLNPKLQNT